MNQQKHWYDYLFILTPIYFALGLFNILFAWLGLIFFLTPLVLACTKWNKLYCNRFCDRGQFFTLLGAGSACPGRKTCPSGCAPRPSVTASWLFSW